MEVTREQLAKALDHLWVHAKNREGTYYAQIVQVTGDSMDSLWESLEEAERRDPWAETDDVVDAHIHCEHAPASRAAYELGHADQIVEMLGRLPERHVKRVLRWAWDYLTDGDEPPF